MKEEELHDELTSIRNLMERSSKFISLSGLSGILAGIYALVGAAIGYFIINSYSTTASFVTALSDFYKIFFSLAIIAITVLLLSIITALILSIKKAKKNGQSVWSKTSKALLFSMAVPLITGGVFIIILIYQGRFDFVLPATLIFYGLALINASNFTFTDVKYLGLCEIALGLIAACIPGYGLLFWAMGFGVLHIIYGSVMYFKYDR